MPETIHIKLEGFEELEQKLKEKSSIRLDAVVKKQLTQMFNRAKGTNPLRGGTPVDTGELRKSVRVDFKGGVSMGVKESGAGLTNVFLDDGNTSGYFSGEIGYTSDYAPHVNFGHRAKKGRRTIWVTGQRFLNNNLEIQSPIYKEDLLKAIRKG